MRRGEMLIERGVPGDSMFVLIEGLLVVRIALGEEEGSAIVNRIMPGAFFGEASLLTGAPRSASVMAETDAVVFEVTRSDIEVLIERRPQLAEELSRALAEHQLRDSQARSATDAEKLEEKIRSASERIFESLKQLFTWGR